MAIELEQIIKFLKIIKIREATGKILSNEVKRECEVKKIEEGLQFLNYKENEDFCCESEIIIKKNDIIKFIFQFRSFIFHIQLLL